MSADSTVAEGRKGEEVARRFLENLGFTILETNYRYGHGEIDIIARDGEDLVFCEVKARTNDEYGEPEYAVTPQKQTQLKRIARGYMYERRLTAQACRFDVVAIRFHEGVPELNHLKNAF